MTSTALANSLELRATSQSALAVGGITVANFTLNQSTPNARREIFSTAPNGWNTQAGRMTVDFEFISNSYFAFNPSSHVAIVTRADMSLIATKVSGQGAIMGNLVSGTFNGDGARYTPTTIIETWDTAQAVGERFLFPNTTGPRNAPLADGQKYRWIVESTLTTDGSRFIRYRLYKWAGATKKAWDAIVDTGDVLDHNHGSDLTKDGLVFGYVFADNLGTWSIDFSNIKVTWGAPGICTADQQTRINKLGADLDGDLSFISAARRVTFPSNTGPSLANSLTFQTSTLNAASNFVVKPNGSASTANILCSNNSNSTTTYGATTFGMAGAEAVIETFGYSAANPVLKVNIGPSNTVATFSASGLLMGGASSYIGQAGTSLSGLIGYGGASATSFCSSAMNIETFSTIGQISSFMSATPTNMQVETITRPAYCMISCLINELKLRKVL